MKDNLKEDKPPNEGQAVSTLVYMKSPLKEDNLSKKYKTDDPEGVLIKRFHCIALCCTKIHYAIHFSDTVSRSAIFCAAMTAIERFKADSVVDIYKIVKSIRLQKTSAIMSVVRTTITSII